MKRLCFFILAAAFLSLASQIASAAEVRGRLEWVTRDPASGLAVTAYAPTSGRTAPVYSGPDGMFYLTVPAGTYYLQVWTSRDPGQPPQSFKISVVEPFTDIAPITLDLHTAGHIEPPSPTIAHLPGFGNRILHDIQPVGLAFLSSDLVVGDKHNNRILLVTPNGNASVIANVPSDALVNIAASEVDGREVIAAVSIPDTQVSGVWVYKLSHGQDLFGNWHEPNNREIDSCALYEDANTRTVYVADNMAVFYKVDLRDGHPSGAQIAQISTPIDVPSIKVIATDPSHSRLFAFDNAAGALYQVTLESGHAHPHKLDLVGSLGNPVAMAVTTAGDRLYSVEGNRIRVIQLDATPLRVRVFLQDHRFHSLSALAIRADGQIWVGDKEGHAIYVISPDGQVAGVLSAQ